MLFFYEGSNSDLAYETMFDEDDDMLNQEQTMPWFDPNYLASKENEDVSFKSPHKHNVNALHQVLPYTFGISVPSILGACIHILTSYAPSKKLRLAFYSLFLSMMVMGSSHLSKEDD